MKERIIPGPICDNTGIREAVCINTRKIYDSCREEDTTPFIPDAPSHKGSLRENALEKTLRRGRE